jgi:hypothetical protein
MARNIRNRVRKQQQARLGNHVIGHDRWPAAPLPAKSWRWWNAASRDHLFGNSSIF